jgi:arylsulfatase A-like enzyme
MPTILEACGVPVPEDVQGISLLGVLDGRETGPIHEAIFTEMTEHVYYIPTRAARTERFKYIRNYSDNPFGLDQLNNKEWAHSLCELPDQPWKRPRVKEELYDLSTDPNESVNLVDDPGYKKDLEAMRDLLRAHMAATGDPFLNKEFTLDFKDNPEIVEPLDAGEKTY